MSACVNCGTEFPPEVTDEGLMHASPLECINALHIRLTQTDRRVAELIHAIEDPDREQGHALKLDLSKLTALIKQEEPVNETTETEAPAITLEQAEKTVVRAAEKLVEEETKFRRLSAAAGRGAQSAPDETDLRKAHLDLNRAVANMKNARKGGA